MTDTNATILFVPHDWDRLPDLLDLYYRVLYQDWAVDPHSDWFQPDDGSLFVVALDVDGGLLGAARLMPVAKEPSERQVRQVAVSPPARGRGLGRELMRAVEDTACDQGAHEIWLHARNTAYDFYSAAGYRFEGPEFVSELTGIPHTTMRKTLGRS